MSGPSLEELLKRALEQRELARQLRRRISLDPLPSTHVELDGQICLNFASNNYLGLSQHPRIRAAVQHALTQVPLGAAASPLITGQTRFHTQAEQAIAQWKQTPGAVLFPSGYQAAHGVIQTLASLGSVRFLLDKLAHASLIDAVTGSGRPYRVFPHNHLPKLKRLLDTAAAGELQVVITESIFSMDGDAADLTALAALKKEYGFSLVLDEAHGSGVYGETGAGLASELGLPRLADVTIVTLSKSLALAGGAACGSQCFCQAVANFGRAYVYSTAISPLIAAAIPTALAVMREEPWRRERVRRLALQVRDKLTAAGFRIPAGDSPIIPILLQHEERAIEAAAKLRERGLLVLPIRPPTVAQGTSRLRVTLSAAHTDVEIEQLLQALVDLRLQA